MIRFVLKFLFLLLVCTPAWAGTLRLAEQPSGAPIGQALEYLAMSADTPLTLTQARNSTAWVPSTENTPNFGFTSKHYWFRLGLQSTETKQTFLLLIDYALLDAVDVYLLQQGQLVDRMRAGNDVPIAERRILYRTFLFPLELDGNQQYEIYLNVRSSMSLQLPISLWLQNDF